MNDRGCRWDNIVIYVEIAQWHPIGTDEYMNANTKKKKEIRVNVRVSEAEKNALRQAGTISGITETLIVRSAIKRAVADIHRQVDAGKGVAIVI